MSTKFQLGDKVVLHHGDRKGVVRFVGETHFADGIWYGIELHADFTGKNDGSIDGEEYFNCKEGQGLFVRELTIKYKLRNLKKKVKRNILRETTSVQALFREKLKTSNKPTQRASRKLGPREIGRNKGWKSPSYEIRDSGEFLAEKRMSAVKSEPNYNTNSMVQDFESNNNIIEYSDDDDDDDDGDQFHETPGQQVNTFHTNDDKHNHVNDADHDHVEQQQVGNDDDQDSGNESF